MKSIFVVLKGENGAPQKISEKGFAIEEKELNRLESDFKQYFSGEVNDVGDHVVQGGVYECSNNGKQKKLFLRFDDVLVIH